MKKIVYGLMAALALVISSCSDNDYLNAVPAESSMLISMNTARLSGAGGELFLRSALHAANVDQCGLDLASNVMMFEDVEGNLGLCAKVDDASKLEETLEQAHLSVREKRGYKFAALENNWMIGFSDAAALLMGPVVPAQQQEMMVQMARYLDQDEDNSIVTTDVYAKLDSIDAPIAMVCQAKALPDQLVAPFTIGAPKGTDPSQVWLAASMTLKQGRMWIDGHTFAFKKRIDDALRQTASEYRPIGGRYVASMSKNDAMGMFMNVDGKKYMKHISENRGIQAMLSGINEAIDMNNIIRSVDGDMALVTPTLGTGNVQLMMAAKLHDADWLADVDYWKQSVPAGGHIGDWGRDCYYYTGGKTTFYFGVTPDWQFMSGGSREAALASVKASPAPIDRELQQAIKGQKLVMVINLAAMDQTKLKAVETLFMPFFGEVHEMVFRME